MNNIIQKTDDIINKLETEKAEIFDLKEKIKNDNKINFLIKELATNPSIKPNLFRNKLIKKYLKNQNEIDFLILYLNSKIKKLKE